MVAGSPTMAPSILDTKKRGAQARATGMGQGLIKNARVSDGTRNQTVVPLRRAVPSGTAAQSVVAGTIGGSNALGIDG